MKIDSFPIMEIIGNSIKSVIKITDNVYHAGWMLYFIVIIIVFAIFVMFYN